MGQNQLLYIYADFTKVPRIIAAAFAFGILRLHESQLKLINNDGRNPCSGIIA